LEINLYGRIIKLKNPTVAQAETYERNLTGSEDETLRATVEFLTVLGLEPVDAIGMDFSHITQLTEELLGVFGRIKFGEYKRAKVARFYGWTHDYIMGMGTADFMVYFKAIDPIQAQEQLASFTAADWSSLKQKARTEIYNNIDKLANSVFPKKKVELTNDFLQSVINQHKR